MQKIKSLPKFWRIYIIIVLVFLVAIAAGLVYLWNAMDEYEKSTPEYALAAVDAVFSAEQYDSLAENAKIENSVYESNQSRSDLLQDRLDAGQLQTARIAGEGTATQHVYQVKNEEHVIGSFNLVYKDEGMFGYWQIENPQISPLLWGEVTVRLPSTYQLNINGVPAGEEIISQVDVPYDELMKLSDDIVKPSQTEYVISNLYAQPSLSVVNELGDEAEMSVLEEAPWTVAFSQDAEEQAQYYALPQLPQPAEDIAALQAMAIADAENYSRFLSDDNSFTQLAARLMPGSDIYKEMSMMETMFYTPHTSVSFTDEKTNNIVRYSDDIFGIDVDYLYTVFRGQHRPYLFDTKVTFIYVRWDGGWRIGDIQIRS